MDKIFNVELKKNKEANNNINIINNNFEETYINETGTMIEHHEYSSSSNSEITS